MKPVQERGKTLSRNCFSLVASASRLLLSGRFQGRMKTFRAAASRERLPARDLIAPLLKIGTFRKKQAPPAVDRVIAVAFDERQGIG